MANLIVPYQSMVNWLNAQIDDMPTLNDMRLRLFKEPLTVDLATTSAELVAAEATFPGYVQQTIVGWTDAIIDDGEALTEADTATFTASATNTQQIYGCFATSLAGNKLWFAVRFDAAIPTPFGVELQIDISINLASIFNS